MKVEALKTFRDKYTKEVYQAGEVISVTKERAAEMNAAPDAPLVKKVSVDKSETKQEGDDHADNLNNPGDAAP